MAFDANVWDQLKNLTAGDLVKALIKDGWAEDTKGGSQHIYWKSGKRVSIHFHSGKTYGAKMLQGILSDIGWTAQEMRKLKLIK